RDAVGELRHRREAGAAGALQVVGRRRGMDPRAEHGFARQVPVARVLDHRARGDLADLFVFQRVFIHQEPESGGEHVLVARLGVDGVGAREGDAGASQNGDPAWYGHDEEELMVRSLVPILLAAALALPAVAQDYPAREIRSICNFSAGSGADIVVRFYSDRLSKLAGKPVVVE